MNKRAQVKIIAGALRGHLVKFPESVAIRPTPQRVRETLFNWLMHVIRDAVCLDAFAGSGALGFEALSRGAKAVYAVERDPILLKALRENAYRLNLSAWHGSVGDFLKHTFPCHHFNVVFLDPPFKQNCLLPALQHLITDQLLAKTHYVYFEVEKTFDLSQLPACWTVVKNQVAGQVRYGLLQLKVIAT